MVHLLMLKESLQQSYHIATKDKKTEAVLHLSSQGVDNKKLQV